MLPYMCVHDPRAYLGNDATLPDGQNSISGEPIGGWLDTQAYWNACPGEYGGRYTFHFRVGPEQLKEANSNTPSWRRNPFKPFRRFVFAWACSAASLYTGLLLLHIWR